jgi:hypothetical protein
MCPTCSTCDSETCLLTHGAEAFLKSHQFCSCDSENSLQNVSTEIEEENPCVTYAKIGG